MQQNLNLNQTEKKNEQTLGPSAGLMKRGAGSPRQMNIRQAEQTLREYFESGTSEICPSVWRIYAESNLPVQGIVQDSNHIVSDCR